MRLLHSGNSEPLIVQAQHRALYQRGNEQGAVLAQSQKDDDMAYVSTSTPTQSLFGGFSFARVRNAISRTITAMQVARMHSVMNQMSAEQLRQIGITRSEVADYAEMLILGSSKS